MSTSAPAGSQSSVTLVALLAGAGVVAALYAAAALARAAGYGPHLGPPVVHLAGGAATAARCALVLGVSAGLALALYGRWRPALAVLLAVVVCAPAWFGAVYGPSSGVLWTSQAARALGADSAPVTLAVQVGAVGGLLALTLLAALTAPRPVRPSSAHGTATWGDGQVLRDAERGLVLGRAGGPPPSPGRAVGQARTGARKPGPLLRYDGPGHVLTVAPTRAGKGVGAVVPNLLDHPGPVVVTDPKGENLALTARYRAGVLGHRVVALDPFGLAPRDLFGKDGGGAYVGRGVIERGGLNPLDLVSENDDGTLGPDAADDAALIAEMLVVEDGGGGDNRFWTDEARALLTGLVLYVAAGGGIEAKDGEGEGADGGEGPGEEARAREADEAAEDARSLLMVRRLLTQDGKGLTVTFGQMMKHDHELVKRAGKRMDQKHERERSAVISTAQSHTHFLDSPRMGAVLRRSTFDPAGLRPGHGGLHEAGRAGWGESRHPGPLSVYLLLPPDRLDAFSRWLRLTVATTLTSLAKLGPLAGGAVSPSRRALFLLDEFAQLGPMPPVRRAVSLMAGYGVQVWPFLQDLGQLRRLYPKDWESFVANSDAVQAFGTTDQFTAEYLSRMAGTSTVFHQSQSSGRSRGKHTSRSQSAGATETGRPLVTPDELRRLGRDDQVLLVRGEDPVLARRIAYYDDREFDPRSRYVGPPTEREAEPTVEQSSETAEKGGAPPEGVAETVAEVA